MSMATVGIIGTGMFVPSNVLTNADVQQYVDTTDEWIRTRTGIVERRIAAPDEAASDLAVVAAQRAMVQAGVEASDIDCIIVATMTPDMMCPSTACLVQARIGAHRAAAFDLSAACSGFVYALAMASQCIATGMYRHVLVIGAEVLSRVTDYTDRNTCILFGDGAGAVVLGQTDGGRGFRAFSLGADGHGAPLLRGGCVGGSRYPTEQHLPDGMTRCIWQNGKEVFKFAVRTLEQQTIAVLAKAGLTIADLDMLIPHQANVRIIDAAVEKLRLDPSKVFVNIASYGNMSAATIPIALAEAQSTGRLVAGQTVVLVGFGGGLTWGAAALVW
jgi:3-oxoacyl-[acyl-carrier-protein] synthase-3